jgi:DNA-binding transcriptional ArsR family regulator
MSQPYPITDPAQFEALSSPARGEILDLVELLGPLSIAELARHLGRKPDSLYYHVRKLAAVGLLVESEKRKARRQEEVVYDLPGRPASLCYEPRETQLVRCVLKSIAGMLRLAERNFRQAYEKGLVRVIGGRRNTTHARVLGWFTEEEIVALQDEVERVVGEFRASARKRRAESRLYALTTILVPLEEKGREQDDAS